MNLDNRKYIIYFFVLFIGVVYSLRLFYMQIIDDSWVLRAQEIAEKRKEIIPPRGVVFDRNNKKIVSNKTYYNLMFKEEDITSLDTVSLAKILKWSVEDIRNRFNEIRKKEGTYYNRNTKKRTSNYLKSRSYAFLKEVSVDEMAKIAPFLNKFPGFYKESTSMRVYPYSNAANILGYIAEVSPNDLKKDPFYKSRNNIGKTGIEKYYEKQLRGVKGIKYIVTSALNNSVESYADGKYDTTAVQGAPLKLGLDINLQKYGEKLMQNKKGCIVAIEPSSGEILSLISSPSFDPNLLVGKKKISANYPKLIKNPDKPLYPRPLAAEYPPGSIFKLVQSLIALQEGVVTASTGFPCTKSLVGCHNHPHAQSISEAIKYSCNPYYYYLVKKIIQQGKKKNNKEDAALGLKKWTKYMHSFGLGVRLDSDIYGIRKGLIPTVDFYNRWYGKNHWSFSTIRSISIGQGEVKLTPLQMANIAVIIANKGWFYTPHFVKNWFGEKKHTGIDKKHFIPVIDGMKRVINESGGTARLARIPNVSVCGKTGTVQNPHGKDHSVFIAFAPVENPKIAIAVFIENSGFGGTWAAPTASLMIEKYLTNNILDKEKEDRIINANLLNSNKK